MKGIKAYLRKQKQQNKINNNNQQNVLAEKAQQENVLAGNGYMKDDTYIEYTPAEKVHIQSVNTNKDAEYTDTSPYKKEEYVQETVLGGVKTKKRKLSEKGSTSVLGGASFLGG